jgi:hypothetical protein
MGLFWTKTKKFVYSFNESKGVDKYIIGGKW